MMINPQTVKREKLTGREKRIMAALLVIGALFIVWLVVTNSGQYRFYKGAQYTAGYKELISCPSGWMANELEKNGGVITPEMFHPKLEIIRKDSLDELDGKVEMVVYPWGVTHLYDAVYDAVNILPDTVAEAPRSNTGEVRGSPLYMSYRLSSGLHLSDPQTEVYCSDYPWYQYYEQYCGLHRGWNTFPNGKIYYLLFGMLENWDFEELYSARGWQTIDGSRFYFDESGALQQADLPAGNYTFGEVSFTVDQDGKVKAK